MAGLFLLATQTTVPVTAGSADRTLWLYHTHTHEEGRFTFKHNGQYDPAVLAQLNVFLADWRTHEPTHMDPHLFDLLWEVYQAVGATQPYNIVSAYRTPETNAYLRSRSSAVAEHSQHMLGHAMDVFIPGVNLETLRATAMHYQVGGVGYYPTSGSPFVHMDTGSVRAWPRMTRAQLKTVFPDGKTLHLPLDGTPLSATGRQYAMAEWNKCHTVPCNGAPSVLKDPGTIEVASLDPRERSVQTIAIVAPIPMMRPSVDIGGPGDDEGDDVEADDAVQPFSKPTAMMVATRDTLPADGSTTALGAIADTLAPPRPRTLMTPNDELTAYAPEITPEPGAQRALKMLIERETTGTAPVPAALPAPKVDTSEIRTASLGGTNGLSIMSNIFDMTWTAVTEANNDTAIASTLTNSTIDRAPVVGLKQRNFELIPPEIDHMDDTLTTPIPMTDIHFAEMYQPEGYLDNAAELGPMANQIHLESDLVAPPRYDRFIVRGPLLVASR